MVKRCFLYFISVLFNLSATYVFAAEGSIYQDLGQIESTVKEYLSSQHPSLSHPDHELSVKVLPISARLKLAKCKKPLQINTIHNTKYSGRTSVKVTCNSAKPWKVIVTAFLSVEVPVAIANSSLPKGHTIKPNDIRMEKRSLNKLRRGHVEDPLQIIGKQLKRTISAGSTLQADIFLTPKMIKKGNNVMLQATIGKLIVVSSGTALSDGQLGQQIAVRNNESRRVVRGEVIGPNKIQVIL